MTVGSVLIGIGFALAVINWIAGAIKGAKASDNPWGSQSLEWTTPTPPPPGNWKDVPAIREEWDPYAYARR